MAQVAILLTNLGSPDSCNVKDVNKYLTEFLMDKRVIDIPYLLRLLLVRGIIVPFRAPNSAAKYKSIWTKNGSPLVHSTKELSALVADYTGIPTYSCMRYANPTPKEALKLLGKENPDIKKVILVPLYPHYAMSSIETAVEHVKESITKGNYKFQLSIVKPFYNKTEYINALAASIKPFIDGKFDHILFSYHGLPKRHLIKADVTGSHCLITGNCCDVASEAHSYCYRHQVLETTKLVTRQLNIPESKYSFSFQSRLAGDKWLEPYTDKVLEDLPKNGVKNLLVVCPAFVSDCLETLQEIHIEGKEIFMNAGGEQFTAIPCMNTNKEWVVALADLIKEAN
jgi:ferrochelatase